MQLNKGGTPRAGVHSPSRSKVQEAFELEADAWLNDVRPYPKPEPPAEWKQEVLPRQPETLPPIEHHASTMRLVYVGPGHPLWPVVHHLSECIWQEVQQKAGLASSSESALADFVRKRAIHILRSEPDLSSQIHGLQEAELVMNSLVLEVLGYGPLEALLKDETISCIMAVSPQRMYVERNSAIVDVPCSFEDEQHMLRIIENMLCRIGRHLRSEPPIVDARLLDGSLLNVVRPPYAVNGPAITIRKHSKKLLTMENLIQMGSLTQEMADFLSVCVQAHLNILICGGVDSGRTTLLHALSANIPAEERIVTIEDVPELQLSQKYVVSLVSQVSTLSRSDQLTRRDLMINALRMRPERILLGECQGDEALEILQAMCNGYNGTLMSLYANNARNALTRLELLCLTAGTHMPLSMIRTQIATALDVIVYLSCLRDGSHKIMNIAEVQGCDRDVIKLQSIFYYQDVGMDAKTHEVKGSFKPGGFLPTFLPLFEAMNIPLSSEIFKVPQ